MSIKVASWNLENGFSVERHVDPIIEAVTAIDPDVAVFPEAYTEDSPELVGDIEGRFKALGYEVVHGNYYEDDQASEQLRNGILGISRLAGAGRILTLPYRNVVEFFPVDEATGVMLQLVGAHFDDRNEASRLRQADELVGTVFDTGPRVLAGDLNALHGDTAWARLLRKPAVRAVSGAIPHEWLQSVMTRVSDMATGTAMSTLEICGFNDVDRTRQPTWPSVLPQLALDHIMVSDEVYPTDFTVHEHVPVSDHRAISVVLHT